MQRLSIPYGAGSLALSVPEGRLAGVLGAAHEGGAPSEERQAETIRRSLENPAGPRLQELARGKRRVLIITSDHTRPVPSRLTMPLLLSEVRQGSPDAEITILLGTGMHRAATRDEIIERFGEGIAARENILCHDCRRDRMVDRGELPSGGRLMLNALVDWADLLVSEGFIEPHFFAGFSGGRKSILPGIASEQTVRYNHNARFIKDPRSRQGVLDGNPIHRDMLFAVRAANLAFILNVLLDADKRVVESVAGDPVLAHEAGCARCLDRVRVQRIQADVGVTGNGGYPLDQNIYQCVKGMTAAEACVRPGGVIVLCAECRDGHGGEAFYQMLSGAQSPKALLEEIERVPPERTRADQWQAQILARVLMHARVVFVTEPKNRRLIEAMHMRYARTLDEAMAAAREIAGADATVVAIPDGVGVIVE